MDVNAENEIQTVILEVKSEQKGENKGTTGIETLDVEIQKTDSVGYVLKIRVGDKVMSGEEFRNKYQLASSCFTLQPYNGKLRVTTRGAGHGIGMSQYTANEMAKKKQGYRKILKYFFKGTDIKEVTEIIKKCITTSRSGKNMVRGGDEMKKNEKIVYVQTACYRGSSVMFCGSNCNSRNIYI